MADGATPQASPVDVTSDQQQTATDMVDCAIHRATLFDAASVHQQTAIDLADVGTQQAALVDVTSDMQTLNEPKKTLPEALSPGCRPAISPIILSLLNEARQFENEGRHDSALELNSLAGALAQACACGNDFLRSSPFPNIQLMTEIQFLMLEKHVLNERYCILSRDLFQARQEIKIIKRETTQVKEHIDFFKRTAVQLERELAEVIKFHRSLNLQNQCLVKMCNTVESFISQISECATHARQQLSQEVVSTSASSEFSDASFSERG